MRILVASHTYIVDINREKFKILANLEPDIEVTIVVPRRWKPGGVQNKIIETEFYQEDSFKIVPISNFSQNNQGLLTFGTDIIRLLQKFKPQIIQVEQGSKSLAYSQLIILNKLLKLQAKNILFTWWNLSYELKWPISLLENCNLQNTDGIIAGNLDGSKILHQRGYTGAMAVMPQLGVDEKLFVPAAKDIELSRKFGIKPTDFVVGFVGRFVEEKGLLTLAEALAGLKQLSWKWLLVGQGKLRSHLEEKCREWGISDRIIWVESVSHEEIPPYINLMNCLVLPSQTSYKFKTLTTVGWKEQFGHVLIEAMACKIPVIGSDCGEIPHVIGDAGLVFPEGNAGILRDCLQQLMEARDFAVDLGDRGYHKVMTSYTNQALAEQLLDFYKQLL
ncbi:MULTISPECIES: hormogonium polysaccharide biosynthesis glycosyltransferase HpsO [unclassified Microcoleus]|uniref:hormogonium polysaccharide biosynthesis glycosyltransferase HpsO n=1 Tax=unclassified Microcoleus TaxID=2642155 RepID=UPI001DA65B2F|nr:MULTISPECIES: hormogonium polysaccharide biosynthesis glycosyltransferase HpsO [unclassified Microcoleus]MCC3419672.1 glycosyltransferase family 4 protein [Microcoleus sp. PH2017_07_MST_O_A]MCC3443571.1 glycosyltransferase family 4 protein [Microcoleus sp. PH2017_03_ELD_O_A]MCC3503948.1 glycosyltransferase family 4 protein [Microcoleus sp. PH2017_19_SFW_U_A]MCC3508119.1 glycosyltransferase family 4 protein [Microcoleus sp. PH2017_17_BER_D_A]TAE44139.1 MAG: glycosyltransferase family 4 prote